MDVFSEDLEASNTKYDSLPDYHLRNPLKGVKEEVEAFLHGSRINKRSSESLIAMQRHGTIAAIGSPIRLRKITRSSAIPIDLTIAIDALRDVVARLNADRGFKSFCDLDILKNPVETLSEHFRYDLWSQMRFHQEMLLCLNALSSKRPPPQNVGVLVSGAVEIPCEEGSVIISKSYLGLKQGESTQLTVFHGDWLRMTTDLHTERFLLWMGCTLGIQINEPHYPSWEVVNDVISWGDQILDEFGNQGFKVLKTYEALCLGVLQSRGDNRFVDSGKFLRNTLADLSSEKLRFGDYGRCLSNMLTKIQSVHHISQLYGLHRIWGHPVTNSWKGMEKVLLIGQKDIVFQNDLPLEIGRHFKYIFSREFRQKHGNFPPIFFEDTPLHEALLSNSADGLNLKLYSIDKWDSVSFKQAFNLPESFNLSMIVADKSISLSKSELLKNIESRQTVMNQELRRGVLRWINDDTLDPREFLRSIHEGDFPDDHKIIGLTPKERELNPTPRMFALMSHLMRVYVVITESMLSEHILPCFPQITMTDSLLELNKKIYAAVHPQSSAMKSGKIRHRKTVCVSLDFEKWNGHMRKESTFSVFESLGDLFGLSNLYNATYDIFRESYIYLADGTYLPKIDQQKNFVPEPPLSFTNHKGGMEGLRQKGWTIYTVVCLDMVCSRHNCSYKIMGMGDNQILLLTFSSYKVNLDGSLKEEGLSDMKKELQELFEDLMNTFRQVGLPLKPLETWISEELFAYGKFPVWKGVPLTMDLKRVMRMFPFSNEDIMTVENVLATIAGNAAACTQATPCLGLSYLIGVFMMSVTCSDLLNYHPLLAKGLWTEISSEGSKSSWVVKLKNGLSRTQIGNHKLTQSNIRRLMMNVPRTLGGYVSFHYFSILMRGFPDNLSRDLSGLYLWDKGASQDIAYAYRWVHPIYMPQKSFQLLIEDISAANLLSPVTPLSGVRQTVEKYLTDGRLIRNREFKDLMASRDPEKAEILSEYLCAGHRLHIRLLHDLYDSTIIGYVGSIISKVTKTSTIQRLAVSHSGRDTLGGIMRDESNYFRFFVWRSSVMGKDLNVSCPTEAAKIIRRESWGKELVGVTVAFPPAYMELGPCYGANPYCDCSDGQVTVHMPEYQYTSHEWNNEIGSSPPYFGSMTKEKVVVTTGSRVYSSEPLVRRPIRLLRTINWFVPHDSNAAQWICSCLSSVTDIDATDFLGVTEGTSGAEAHRYSDSSLKHGCLCSSNYLYSTRYHVSTDNLSRYSKGSANHDLHFQALLCSIVEGTHLNIITGNNRGEMLPRTYHYRQCCYTCISELDESFSDIPSLRGIQFIPSRKDNKYLYVTADKISIIEHQSPFLNLVHQTLSNGEYEAMPDYRKTEWLADVLSDQMIADACNLNQNQNDFVPTVLNVKEHSRTAILGIPPKMIINAVLDRLMLISEWEFLTSNFDRKPTDITLKEMVYDKLTSLSDQSFVVLSLYHSWADMKPLIYFCPEMVEPNTIPVTTQSACSAMKMSLMNRIWSHERGERMSSLVVDDHKHHGIIYKMILFSWLRKHSRCHSCLTSFASLRTHNIADPNLLRMKCNNEHIIFDLLPRGYLKRTFVTADRLKKDSKNFVTDELKMCAFKNRRFLPPLATNTVKVCISSDRLTARLITLKNEEKDARRINTLKFPHLMDMYKIIALPTSYLYKYMELFSYLRRDLYPSVGIFVTGDGLGGTSDLIQKMFNVKTISSTLMDSESSMHQSYTSTQRQIKGSDDCMNNIEHSINLTNNVLHAAWVEQWRTVVSLTDVLISDIEILGEKKAIDRNKSLTQQLKIRKWRLACIKDYIYSFDELRERLDIVLRSSAKFQLVTVDSRQSFKPEVWWIMQKTVTSLEGFPVSYHDNVMSSLWDSMANALYSNEMYASDVMQEISALTCTEDALMGMVGRLNYWASMPGIGSFLPNITAYTKLLKRLQRGKRPERVAPSFSKSSLKLYDSDVARMRNILLCMACAMIVKASDRINFINESAYWSLDWKMCRKTKTWIPYLRKNAEKVNLSADITDYVPLASLIMKRRKLLYSSWNETIEFSNEQGYKTLHFHVSRGLLLSLGL